MVIRELLIPMRNPELIQSSHKSARAIEQVELVLLPAVDVGRLQPAQIVSLRLDRDDRVFASFNSPDAPR